MGSHLSCQFSNRSALLSLQKSPDLTEELLPPEGLPHVPGFDGGAADVGGCGIQVHLLKDLLDELAAGLRRCTACMNEVEYSLCSGYVDQVQTEQLYRVLEQIRNNTDVVSSKLRIGKFMTFVRNVFDPEFNRLSNEINVNYANMR